MQNIKTIIIKQLENYRVQKKTTENQVHMLEGAIQSLEILLAEIEASEPIVAGPTSIKGDKGVSNN